MLIKQFVAIWLLLAPVGAAVPTPESHFGHTMGQDRTLLDWDRVVAYFRALDKSSDRIKVAEYGKSVEGRPMIVATIATPETLSNIERYRDIQMRLADPRRTPEAEAEKLAAEGKVVVLITCSIHATEVASTHTAVEFAWRLLTEDKPRFRTILNNVVLLLVPSLNPDGVDIVTRWYRRTLGAQYEGTSPPELYQKYVGHDNNRDWYIFSQPETRATVALQNAWHPQIVYDVHQMGANAARIFVPPWMDPIDPNVDPILSQLCNMVGAGMAADLTSAGKTGVVMNAMYDFWTPSRHYQAYHGGLRILTESASARLASPITVSRQSLSTSAIGYNAQQRSWNHLEPWAGGEWKLRDIVDYQLIAFESLLWQAAVRRTEFLRDFYRMGQKAVARTTPYSFVIPSRQTDPGATKKMLDTLAYGQVEIEQAQARFEAGGKTYAPGTYVVRMQQPYSSWAKTLLERQAYPDLRLYPGGPPRRPYDVTAQTLPLLMGVAVDTVADHFQATLKPVTHFAVELDGAKPPNGGLAASDVDSWRTVNQWWSARKAVYRDPATGDFYTSRTGGALLLPRPRIGMYKSFQPSMDEGWTRWLLEQFGFEYKSLGNAEIQAGQLRRNYDVILFPDQSPSSIHNGYRPGTMPPEYTGGLGEKGAEALKAFANDGGTLIFLNESTSYAVGHLGVSAKNVVSGVSNREYYSPGSLLNVSLDLSHPLARGLPGNIAIWSEHSPAWEVAAPAHTVARYPSSGILASGWLLGEKHLVNRAAILDVQMGKGRAVLFGMRPQYRAQSYQAFKLLFNALVYFQRPR